MGWPGSVLEVLGQGAGTLREGLGGPRRARSMGTGTEMIRESSHGRWRRAGPPDPESPGFTSCPALTCAALRNSPHCSEPSLPLLLYNPDACVLPTFPVYPSKSASFCSSCPQISSLWYFYFISHVYPFLSVPSQRWHRTQLHFIDFPKKDHSPGISVQGRLD